MNWHSFELKTSETITITKKFISKLNQLLKQEGYDVIGTNSMKRFENAKRFVKAVYLSVLRDVKKEYQTNPKMTKTEIRRTIKRNFKDNLLNVAVPTIAMYPKFRTNYILYSRFP
jgi:hypothetical protein